MTTGIDFRPAATADRGRLLELLPQLADFDVPEGRNPRDLWEGDAALLERLLDESADGVFCDVAVGADGNVLGLILVSMREELLSHEPSAHLEAIVVAPDARGMGLGRKLLARAEAEAKARGAESMSLHVFGRNERARALYRAEGWDEELIRAYKRLR